MKILKSVLFPAYFIAFFAMHQGQAQSARKIISQAEKAYFNDQTQQALSLFEKAATLSPENVKVHYRLGQLYLQVRQPEKAVPVLLTASKLTKKYRPEYTLALATAYHQSLNFTEAQVQYKALLASTKKRDEEMQAMLQKRIRECEAGLELQTLPVLAEVRNMPGSLNTAASEHGLILTNNDKTLIFTSNRKTGDSKHPDENVYQAQFDGQHWLEPQAFGKPINTNNHDAATGISADGNTLYIYRFSNGGDVYEVKRSGSTWGTPQPMPDPINSPFFEPSLFITPDNQFAFFASDREEGYGGLDLYITMRQPDGTWSEAMNLGPNINTEFDEDAPFITPDGLTLYFSSRGHNSMGGYDVFSSNAEGITWTKARNLGFPVNSPYDDIYLVTTASGNQGYFSSDRSGGSGEKDIYSVTFRREIATDSVLIADEPVPALDSAVLAKAPVPQTIMLRGFVTDAKLGAPLAAQLVLTETNLAQSPVYANADSISGGYQFEVLKGKKYNLVARKEGYFYATEKLNLPEAFPNDTLAKNFVLRKIKTGEKLVLNNLFFEYNSDKVTAESREELNRLYELLLENPGITVEISGHTDSRGSAAYNQTLSLKRAKAVVDYLQQKGIGTVKLKAVGYGASKPIASNKTEDGRKQNRRTEFKVIQE